MPPQPPHVSTVVVKDGMGVYHQLWMIDGQVMLIDVVRVIWMSTFHNSLRDAIRSLYTALIMNQTETAKEDANNEAMPNDETFRLRDDVVLTGRERPSNFVCSPTALREMMVRIAKKAGQTFGSSTATKNFFDEGVGKHLQAAVEKEMLDFRAGQYMRMLDSLIALHPDAERIVGVKSKRPELNGVMEAVEMVKNARRETEQRALDARVRPVAIDDDGDIF